MRGIPISSANARELALKSAEVRRQRKIAAAAELQALREAVIARALAPACGPVALNPAPKTDHAPARDRLAGQLAELDRQIDAALASDPDASKADLVQSATRLDRLCSARARLWEQWRILSAIPMPGSKRPPPDRPQRATHQIAVPLGPAPRSPDEPPAPVTEPATGG